MKYVIDSGGVGLAALRSVETDPVAPGPGEILVKVQASSLNFHDYLVATGLLPVADQRVPLSDGVGVVIEVGADVDGFACGDRVMGTFFPDWISGPPDAVNIARMRGEHVDGFASEFVTLPATSFTPVPAHLTDIEAATLPCAGLTAWRALMVEGQLRAGETVLIEGAGGVSVFALQFAKMVGAKVIALSSTPERMDKLTSLGADHVLNYRELPEWSAAVRELTDGLGVDHVVEVVGGNLAQPLQASAVNGNIHLIGALSRHPIQFPAGQLIYRNARLSAVTVGSRQHQTEMLEAVGRAALKPIVDSVFPLNELRAAFTYQESGSHFGKVCVRL